MNFENELIKVVKQSRKQEMPIVGDEFTNTLTSRIIKEFKLSTIEDIIYYFSSFYSINTKFVITNYQIAFTQGNEKFNFQWADIESINYDKKTDYLVITVQTCIHQIPIKDCCDLKPKFLNEFADLLNNKSRGTFIRMVKNEDSLDEGNEIEVEDEFELESSHYVEQELQKIEGLFQLGEYQGVVINSERLINELIKTNVFQRNAHGKSNYLVFINLYLSAKLSFYIHNVNIEIPFEEIDDVNIRLSDAFKLLSFIQGNLKDIIKISEDEKCDHNELNDIFQKTFQERLIEKRHIGRKLDLTEVREYMQELINQYDTYKETLNTVNAGFNAIGKKENLWFDARKQIIKKLGNDINDKFHADLYSIVESKITDSVWEKAFDSWHVSKRQFLVVFKDIAGRYSDEILTFEQDRVPSFLKFPLNHPVPNILYTSHPYDAKLYVPYEEAELLFFEDKISEFYLLLQGLGATQIKVISQNGLKVNEAHTNEVNVGVEGAVRIVGAKINADTKTGIEDDLSINSDQYLLYEFNPYKKPYVPTDLIWYPKETKWQRLASMRLNGDQLSFTQNISTKEVKFTSKESELNVSAEFNALLSKGKANADVNSKRTFQSDAETTWKIEVKFKSINELNNLTIPIANHALTETEQQYLEEYLFVCENGPIINENERYYLNRRRQKLGVSEERANEIEACNNPFKMTEAELEYVEELKEVMIDGKIPEQSWRVLDRLRNQLAISDFRAREIQESLVQTSD
ncbi:hypothetical protein [Pedobacter immunditicola]|uniref:hypothetical protein n=1 Tax=Pedobacter immunditicola TaxID=3133440 RepID=UPI0030B542B1